MDEKARIEKIMQKENMNSAQFALETGIQTSTLSHILNGRNKVSLDVLKRILNRFSYISSDWLILGVGTMNRQEKQSQMPGLFDNEDENTSGSDVYVPYEAKKKVQENPAIQEEKTFSIPQEVKNVILPPIFEKPQRRIRKIIVYFDDNSFQEFEGY